MTDRIPVRATDPAGGMPGQSPVINAAGTAVEWGDVAGGFNPDAGRSPRLVPYGVKIRGSNINAKVYSPDVAPWGKMFAEWDTLWDTYIKPQIDSAASVGANTIRMMGAAPSVLAGYCTQTQYLTGYEQLVDYCASQGLYVYGCLSASQEWFGQSVAAVMPVMKAQAAMLDTKPNVIGIDVCQEIGLTANFIPSTSIHDEAAQLVVPIRDVTSLSLTCSVTVTNNTSSGAAQFAATTVTAYDDLFDHFDYHPYYEGMTVADVQTAADAAEAVGKVIMFGEFGATQTALARYEEAAVVCAALPNLVGAINWAAGDRLGGTGPWGLFDESWNPRSELVVPFQKIPDNEGARSPGPTLLVDGVLLPARGRIDFTGDISVIDSPDSDTTTVSVTLPAATPAAASSGELLMQDGITAPPVPLETEARDDWLYQG